MKKIILYVIIVLFPGLNVLVAQTVTGTVTSTEDSQSLLGVTIQVKGSTIGTVTDLNGNYSIDVPSLDETLVFSYIGFIPVEIDVGGQTTINVELEPTVFDLEEVMVTAYGTSKRIEFTGSASVAKSEDLEKVVTTSVLGALQGTVSGVQVQNYTSQPGSTPEIRIRGISSINGNSTPLYVLNGAPFGGELNAINLNDVESISVLKDASATALYGSRASAGVILITTKKGTQGKPVVTFKASAGMTSLAMPLHKRVNNAQYYEMRWEAGKNGYLDGNPGATLAEAQAYATSSVLDKLGGYNSFDRFPLLANGKIDPAAKPRWGSGPTDWEDAIIKPAPRQDYYLGVRGATADGIVYNFSLGYLRETGAWSFSKFNRITSRLNVSKKFSERIEIGLNSAYTNAIRSTPNVHHCFRYITDMPDIYPVYQWDDATNDFLIGPDGGKVFDMGGGNEDSYNGLSRRTWSNIHPLQQERDDIFDQKQHSINAGAFISITPFKGLNFKSQLTVDSRNNQYKSYWSSEYSWSAGRGGQTYRESWQSFVYTFSNLLSYNNSFGDHNINLLGGMEAYSMENQGLYSEGQGFPLPTLTEIGASSLISYGSSYVDEHRIQSYLSKLDYNYQGKYFFSASFRRDGTSRFHKDTRWGNFGSLGASWRMSKENFIANVSWLSDLSLRASYGTQGNENIASYYAYHGTYNLLKDLGSTALLLNTLSNTKLKWEKNAQTNIGFTANLYKRININFDYFLKKSQDLLFSRELPISSGVGSISENVGDVQNNGFDFELHTYNLPVSSRFKWETFINISHYKNEITKLPSEEISAGYYRYKVGVSTFEYYIREWRGVNPANGSNLWSTADGSTTEVLNDAALDFRGSALPDFYGNVMNTFGYMGIDLSVNIVFSFGGQIYDYLQSRASHAGSRNLAETFIEAAYDYWTPENPNASYPRMTDHGPTGNDSHQTSTRWLWDRTYGRVRNITLGYTLPNKISSRIGSSNIRVYLQADNQITWFKGKEIGLDPEHQISGTMVYTYIPPMKTILGGVSFTF